MATDVQELNRMSLENYTVRALELFPDDGLTGRTKITTNVREINRGNVVEVLEKALPIHAKNAREITYLYDYYRGRQDIRKKSKNVREYINNKVMVNRANEIVTFKTAYLLNEPIQYVSHNGDDTVSENVNRLNEFMRAEDKESKDKEIIDWIHICGVAERLVLPDDGEVYGAPFRVDTLDPREAFVIYSAGIGRRPMASVILQQDEDDTWYALVYTKDTTYKIVGRDIVEETPYAIDGFPLVEYVNNAARMGAFETVIPILNNINQLESDAVDSVDDFINGFDVFQNCDIEDGDYSDLAIGGKAVKIKTVTQGMEAKVYRVYSELNQTGVQTRIDDMTEAYLTICGMPNRNGGSSTSDTGSAVIFRDGWSEAESRAKDTEKLFKRSEREFLRTTLSICEKINERGEYDLHLTLADFDPDFLRKNLSNSQSKVQILCELLNNPKVHPKLAFEVAGSLFKDVESAYTMSSEYYEENQKKLEESLEEELNRARVAAVETSRRSDSTAQSESNPEV